MKMKIKSSVLVCLLILFAWPFLLLGMDGLEGGASEPAQKCSVVIVGAGKIGTALVQRILQERAEMFTLCGLFTSSRYLINERGITGESVKFCNKYKTKHDQKELIQQKELALINSLPAPFIVVDTTSDDATLPLLELALARGGYVVMANKKPLAAEQEKFDRLCALGADRLFYRTTVGAGLPVISTLKTLLDEHAEIESISGVFSGTLGFIFSQINAGAFFSEAVRQAYEKGFTEPHPKEDLAGSDVARKLLILARTMGLKVNLDDVQISPLYLPTMEDLSPERFLIECIGFDYRYRKQEDESKRLCYVARISKSNESYKLRAGVELINESSPFFDLKGPENMFVFTLKDRPAIIIRGLGAGTVTVDRLFEDICSIGERTLQ